MANKQYRIAWAKIGNAAGFRFNASFFRENPQFKGAEGAVEVIAPDTLLVRLQPQELEPQEDEIVLKLYLDFLIQQALLNPHQELEPYTEAMAAEDEELMAGVEIEDEWSLAGDR
jgi:antitoxin PrlF